MDTRQRIIESASRLFHEQGYGATSIAAILSDAGVNSGSLYHFFASKEAVLESVLEMYLARLYPQIMQPAELAEPDPLDRIFYLMDWYRTYMQSHACRLGCPVGNLALEVADNHPRIKLLLERNFRNWVGIIRNWLDEAAHRLPENYDLPALAGFILTVMEGGIMQSRAAGSVEPFDQSVAQLRSHIDALLQQRKNESAPLARAG